MLDAIYPEEESKLFSGRGYYLNLLKNNKEDAKKGIGKNIILAGQKGIGKSTIIKEFMKQAKDVEAVFINLEKTSLSPESFAIEFIGNILFWSSKAEDYLQFMDINYISKLSMTSKCKEIIKTVKNELEKIKPNQNLILEKAFSFPRVFAEENKKKILVCIAELQELEALNKYEQVKNALSLFEKNIAGCSVIATSSDSKFPLKLSEFSAEKVGYLDEKETAELAGKLSKKINAKELYSLTLGHPYYIKAVCSSGETDLKKAFLQQLLGLEGRINIKCRELLAYHMSRARGKSLLFILLKALSQGPMRLNEASKKIFRSSPVTKSLLSRLIDVDIISLRNGQFSFNDPILQKYVNLAITRNLEGAKEFVKEEI